MSANQFYAPVRGLRREKSGPAGGLFRVYYAVVEDVGYIPPVNPATGIIDTADIDLLADKYWYLADAPNRRGYREGQETGDDGPSIGTVIKAVIPFASKSNHLTLDRLKHHRFIVIAQLRDRSLRIVGSRDNPVRITHITDLGEVQGDAAGNTITFTWTSEDKPIVYEGNVSPVMIT